MAVSTARPAPPRCVGIGASAGGIAALQEFFEHLSVKTGMAFIIIQHLSPDHPSNMASILANSTSMPVSTLDRDVTPLPNHVYVRPPDKVIELDSDILVLPPRDGNFMMVIDQFFFSMADALRQDSICVILSGMGTDGSRGAREIKERGGLVLVQSPQSARFGGMPRAVTEYKLEDFAGTPTQLAGKLTAAAARLSDPVAVPAAVESPPDPPPALVDELLKRIKDEHQLDFTAYRRSTINRRIEKRLLIHHVDDAEGYLKVLREDPEELPKLAKSFLIGVTRFFRDQEAFNTINSDVIPALANIIKQGRQARVWVGACSTGEEAYSIAMLLDDYLRQRGLPLNYRILASDVDPLAIKFANLGVYHYDVAPDIPEAYFNRYFQPTLEGPRVISWLRDRLLFAVHNLLTDPPFINVDFITCRNFLIYVNNEAQTRVLGNFHFALNDGGHLMLGASESMGRLRRSFDVVNRRWKLFRRAPTKERGRASWPMNEKNDTAPELTSTTSGGEELRFQNHPKSPPVTDVYAQYLSDRFAPISIFIDEEYVIHYINGRVDELLRFPRRFAQLTVNAVFNPEAATMVRTAVNTVLKNDDDSAGDVNVDHLPLRDRACQARFSRIVLPNTETTLALVEFLDIQTGTKRNATLLQPEELYQRRIKELETQLSQSTYRAEKLLAELEATNEELQTSNRELLASNEEMQSTNEELQSVNEELYIVNNESQLKNDELKRLNSDISHLLESTEIGTIFLDKELNIRRFTPSIRHLFNLHATDVGRPLSAFANGFEDLDLIKKCAGVLDTLERYEGEHTDKRGNYYLIRILPYQSADNGERQGLILTFVDINELVETQAHLAALATKYKAILQHANQSILVLDQSGRVLEANHWPWLDHHADDLIDKYLVDFITETKGEWTGFMTALRITFEQGIRQVINVEIPAAEGNANYAELTLIPLNLEGADENERSVDTRALVIIRDTTESVLRRREQGELLERYRRRMDRNRGEFAFLELDGTIIDLTSSVATGLEPSDFIENNVYDFLTPSGAAKIKQAFAGIMEGSLIECVTYHAEDLKLDNPQLPIRIEYRPVITRGEIRFILVHTLFPDSDWSE